MLRHFVGEFQWFVHGDAAFVHKGHPIRRLNGVSALPKRLKDTNELEIAKSIMTSLHDSSAACTVYFQRTGDTLSRQFLHNLKRSDQNLATTAITNDDASSPADRLLKALDENEDVDYIAMFADDTSELFTETSIYGDRIQHGERIQYAKHAVSPDVAEEIREHRKALHLSKECKSLLSVMWVRRQERNLFAARPHALHIDFTANTNSEKMPLFLGTGVTAWNESVTTFRGITPCEKLLWTDTLINLGLPRLLGASLYTRVNVGIGDQCGNEIISWNKARGEGTHNALYRICGLHKINFGLRDLSIIPQLKDETSGKRMVKDFIKWHYWFCRSCESLEEQNFARKYLDAALRCDPFLSACGESVTQQLKEWSDSSFFTVSHMLVHFHFMKVLGGRIWTNSIGEGQNSAHKMARGGTRGNHSTDVLFEKTDKRYALRAFFVNQRF